MRMVIWTDEDGYMHRSMLKDNEFDNMAPNSTKQDPPSIEDLDWNKIKRDLHNALVGRGVFDYEDVIVQQSGVTGAILDAMRRPVLHLYKKRRSGKQ